MTKPDAPSARGHAPIWRRRAGDMLRTWRETAGIRTGEAARLMGWTSEKMSRVERGAYRVYEDDVHQLAAHYGVTDESYVREVVQVATGTPDNAWWMPYEKRLTQLAGDMFWLYSQAETITTYHPTLPPNILQEPDYIRRLRETAPDDLRTRIRDDEFVSMRVGMRSVLFRPDRLKSFAAYVPEVALGVRDLFGPDITRRQLTALLDPPHHPGLHIRVVTTASAAHTLRGGGATFMTFRKPWPDVVFIDSPPVVAPITDPDQVSVVRRWLDPISEFALSVADSKALISDYLTRCG